MTWRANEIWDGKWRDFILSVRRGTMGVDSSENTYHMESAYDQFVLYIAGDSCQEILVLVYRKAELSASIQIRIVEMFCCVVHSFGGLK